ncbi:cell cycle control protein 50A isoform X2 [Homalodisca vitripennis]|uniref:cell cycle control protein 50A isoform X2 n=1 Tax=Homalodisca vitripennis TaxID=197043 RepID=UPI001EEC94B7|nr:cell cycle control protein 50A isoform X2 [Homalodisca vitripennis]
MSTSESSNIRSKRPADSAFKQQRLPAWQPILTAGTVLPTFFIVGITFIPIGIGLLYFSDGVGEKSIDYTYCKSVEVPTQNCADIVTSNNSNAGCTCRVPFTLNTPLEGTVYMYYGLSNFYQNHRRYVKSRDDFQLLGQLSDNPSTDCDPFRILNNKPIAPCGAIANSLFSDVLTIFSQEINNNVPLLRTDIAWPSDKEVKFRNPPIPAGQTLKDVFKNYERPPMWKKYVWELDTEISGNNGFQNEDLIVWMRTAALPSFRKLYRRVDHSIQGFTKGLPKGNYTLIINYNYPVTEFEGKKQMILSTTSILGGKNPFMGYAYIVVGCICLVLGIAFLIIHIKFGKSEQVSWYWRGQRCTSTHNIQL